MGCEVAEAIDLICRDVDLHLFCMESSVGSLKLAWNGISFRVADPAEVNLTHPPPRLIDVILNE
jgi:hypothetical protein